MAPALTLFNDDSTAPDGRGINETNSSGSHAQVYATSEEYNALREQLVRENTRDIVVVEHEQWLKHYGPFQISEEDLARCMQHMSSETNGVVVETTPPNAAIKSWKWSSTGTMFPPHKPCESGKSEHQTFKPLVEAFRSVCRANIRPHGRQRNRFVYIDCPCRELASDIVGVNHWVDCGMVEEDHAEDCPLHASHMPVIGEFKKWSLVDDRVEVPLHWALGVSHFTMCNDSRRMWIYAMTVEDDQLTLWYFSRSHSAKSMSFNWYENPELLVRVFLLFAYATEEELGIDPRVHQFSEEADASGNAKAKLGHYYVYKFPPKDTDGTESGTDGGKEKKTRYFRTIGMISEQRTLRIRSRFTRVWKVVEVAGIEPGHHRNPKTCLDGPFALKEACLDAGVPTEVENQAKLFADVEKFIERPESEWMQDPRLKDFTDDMKAHLKVLFQRAEGTGEYKYKTLFLDAIAATEGLTTKEACPEAWPSQVLFNPDPPIVDPNVNTDPNDNTRAGVPPQPAIGAGKLGAAARNFAPKRQSRFVYREVCTSLYDVATFGDVMNIFSQSLVALQVMFCAGWVHRDISPGNLLVYEGKVKLADLEYAKPYPDNERKVTWDPKTGTPDFMPNEILAGKLTIEDVRCTTLTAEEKTAIENMIAEQGPTPELIADLFNIRSKDIPEHVVLPQEDQRPVHNFQHDVESTWWSALWFITLRAGHDPSIESVRQVFSGSLKRNPERRDVMEAMKCNERRLVDTLLPPLSPLVSPLDKLRTWLRKESLARVLAGGLLVPASYSRIHVEASRAFTDILATGGKWRSLPLSPLDKAQPPRQDLKRPNDGPLDEEEGNNEDDVRNPSPTPYSRSTPATPMMLTQSTVGSLHKKQRRG